MRFEVCITCAYFPAVRLQMENLYMKLISLGWRMCTEAPVGESSSVSAWGESGFDGCGQKSKKPAEVGEGWAKWSRSDRFSWRTSFSASLKLCLHAALALAEVKTESSALQFRCVFPPLLPPSFGRSSNRICFSLDASTKASLAMKAASLFR